MKVLCKWNTYPTVLRQKVDTDHRASRKLQTEINNSSTCSEMNTPFLRNTYIDAFVCKKSELDMSDVSVHFYYKNLHKSLVKILK